MLFKWRQQLKQQTVDGLTPCKKQYTHALFLCHEQFIVMTVCHWSCRNTLEARSPMSSDMAQGEGLEPMYGLCGEAAGESWLSSLSHPAETLIKEIALPLSQSSLLPSLFLPCGVENHWGRCCLDRFQSTGNCWTSNFILWGCLLLQLNTQSNWCGNDWFEPDSY